MDLVVDVFPDGCYSLDTGFACGMVTISMNRVVPRYTAPIFVKLFRHGIYNNHETWKWIRLGAVGEGGKPIYDDDAAAG